MQLKKVIIPGAIGLAAIIGLAEGLAINGLGANAATTASAPTGSTVLTAAVTDNQPTNPPDPSQGGHVGVNGVKEEVLTGDSATKATAAAQTAVPGATILRVETDAEGATYEAHMKKSDGSLVTVKMDANFKVTGIENGMGPGGRSQNVTQSSAMNTN